MNRKLIKQFIGPLFLVLLLIWTIATYFIGESLTNEHIGDPPNKEYGTYSQVEYSTIAVIPGLAMSTLEGPEQITGTNPTRNYSAGNERSYESWTAISTFALAVITFFLALFTAGLWSVTVRLSKEAKSTSDRQEGQMEKSIRISEDSINLSRSQFFATHRPKIIIHTFEHVIDSQKDVSPVLTYVNAGASSATTTKISTTIFWTDKLAPGIEMTQEHFDEVINPGEFKTFTIQSGIDYDAVVFNTMKKGRSSNQGVMPQNMICVGKISYIDNAETKRETGFCRRFDSPTNCWLKIKDSDYEYNY